MNRWKMIGSNEYITTLFIIFVIFQTFSLGSSMEQELNTTDNKTDEDYGLCNTMIENDITSSEYEWNNDLKDKESYDPYIKGANVFMSDHNNEESFKKEFQNEFPIMEGTSTSTAEQYFIDSMIDSIINKNNSLLKNSCSSTFENWLYNSNDSLIDPFLGEGFTNSKVKELQASNDQTFSCEYGLVSNTNNTMTNEEANLYLFSEPNTSQNIFINEASIDKNLNKASYEIEKHTSIDSPFIINSAAIYSANNFLNDDEEEEDDDNDYDGNDEGTNSDFGINKRKMNEGKLSKNLYISSIGMIIPYLHDIFPIIQESNTENKQNLDFCLINIKSILHPLDINKVGLKKHTHDVMRKPLKLIYDNLDEFEEFLVVTPTSEDAICILDSSIFIKMYFILLSCFSSKYLNNESVRFKEKAEKKQEVFKSFPQSGKDFINMNSKKLQTICAELSFGSLYKRSFYQLRILFRIVFSLYDGSSETINELFESSLEKILSDIKKMNSDFQLIVKRLKNLGSMNLQGLTNIIKYKYCEAYMNQIYSLISFIENTQRDIKNYIRGKFKDPSMIALYLKYGLSSLMIERMFILSGDIIELQECFSVLKEFLNLWDHHFSSIIEYHNFSDLNEIEKKELCKNDDVLFYVILYFNLNLSRIFILKIKNEYASICEKMSELKETTQVKLKGEIVQIRLTHLIINELLKTLDAGLSSIKSCRTIVKKYMDGFKIGDTVNSKNKEIIFLILDNIKNISAFDKRDHTMIKNYEDIRRLYEDFFKICKEL